jgi:hypothetical protein
MTEIKMIFFSIYRYKEAALILDTRELVHYPLHLPPNAGGRSRSRVLGH